MLKTPPGSLLLFLLLLTSTGTSARAEIRCRALFEALTPYQQGLPQGLREHRNQEVSRLSRAEVTRLNNAAITKLQGFVPPLTLGKAQAIEPADAQAVVNLLYRHEVTGYEMREKYRRPDVEIGFCFGRATLAHLALLKMGLYRDSIVKLWAIGPMETPGVTWDFHVATAAYVKNRGWMVLDSNYASPLSVSAWFAKMREQNKNADGKVRLYITEPNKFGVDDGKYSRVQMGLDLTRETDWYQNYFVDMMKSIGPKTPEELGLRRLPPHTAPGETLPSSRGFLNIVADFFRD